MEGTEFDELAFFGAIAESGARALLIGRRALIVLGLPLMTSDYDFWLHVEDVELFNGALSRFDLVPTVPAAQARQRGRYVLENDERVDVLLGRSVPTVEGERVVFDDVWNRRRTIELTPGLSIAMPSLDDLIATKKFGARPKDAEDVRLLEALRRNRKNP